MSYILKKYGTATTVLFPLIDAGAQDFESTPVTFASGDTQISKDAGTFANTSNNPAHEGNGIYSLALTATEMQAATVVVTVIDSATKAWEDQAIIIDTYGNASAEHAIDLDDAVRAGLTALPNAAADAAGGLPISDAGGLDLDALNTNVNDIETDTTDIQSRLPAALVGGAMNADVSALQAGAIDAILDEVVEGTLTMRQVLRIFLSALAGKSTGGGTSSVTFRDNADAKARISATVDASGNRTAMTLDGT